VIEYLPMFLAEKLLGILYEIYESHMRILQVLHDEQARSPFASLDSTTITQRLGIQPQNLEHLLATLKIRNLIDVTDHTVGTRVFFTIKLSRAGIDAVETWKHDQTEFIQLPKSQESIPVASDPAIASDEISAQLSLLAAHRRTLLHYLKQRALLGSAHAPPANSHGIEEARAKIQSIKAWLIQHSISVEDLPNDTLGLR